MGVELTETLMGSPVAKKMKKGSSRRSGSSSRGLSSPVPSSRARSQSPLKSKLSSKKVLPGLGSPKKTPKATHAIVALQSSNGRVQAKFSFGACLADVINHFKNTLNLPTLSILTIFINDVPRRYFKTSERSKTLKQLNFPARTLIIYEDPDT